ncbi:MAG TPA: S1/P1 nuclease [Acidisarcina sp.]
MKKLCVVAVVSAILFAAQPARAWFNGGHMVVAYVAYKNLKPQQRARVDALLMMNPMYTQWTNGVSKQRKGLVAFLNAAVWPDCIKQLACSPGYIKDGPNGGDTPPGNATDAQNIGYADKLMHKYWHFVDIPDSAGAPGLAPKTPNALTEIKDLSVAIGTAEGDDIKSYDVVWLEHLVGDVHQPLHATSRFTVDHPQGDAGGNFVKFCVLPCRDELHAYWDGLLGDTPTIGAVSSTGQALVAKGRPSGASITDPAAWVDESAAIAKSFVYVAPISDDNDPAVTISPRPDAAYQKRALKLARSQVALAGYRLADLLNTNLK